MFSSGRYGQSLYCTNILDFRGFDSNIISILRGGILMSIGDFPETLSQAMLAGVMLVGRLSIACEASAPRPRRLAAANHGRGVAEGRDYIYIYIYIYKTHM